MVQVKASPAFRETARYAATVAGTPHQPSIYGPGAACAPTIRFAIDTLKARADKAEQQLAEVRRAAAVGGRQVGKLAELAMGYSASNGEMYVASAPPLWSSFWSVPLKPVPAPSARSIIDVIDEMIAERTSGNKHLLFSRLIFERGHEQRVTRSGDGKLVRDYLAKLGYARGTSPIGNGVRYKLFSSLGLEEQVIAVLIDPVNVAGGWTLPELKASGVTERQGRDIWKALTDRGVYAPSAARRELEDLGWTYDDHGLGNTRRWFVKPVAAPAPEPVAELTLEQQVIRWALSAGPDRGHTRGALAKVGAVGDVSLNMGYLADKIPGMYDVPGGAGFEPAVKRAEVRDILQALGFEGDRTCNGENMDKQRWVLRRR